MPNASDSDAVGATPTPSMTVDASVAGTGGVIDTPNEPATPAPAAEPVTAETATTQPATTTESTTTAPLVPPAPAEAAVAPPIAQPVTRPSRRGAVARGTLRLIGFVLGVGLFVFGIWIGVQVFQSTQKPTDPVGATAVSNGVPTPPVVEEFAHALQTGGPDAVRSSVSTDVFALLTSELQRWSYSNVTKVDVLSTAVDGPRSATGLILTGTTTDGRTMWINLIVHTENGQISTLR